MSRGRGGARGRGRGASQSSNRTTTRDDDNGSQHEFTREAPAPLAPTVVVFEKRTPAELQQLKLKLLNTVSASLIKEPRFDTANSIASTITLLVKEIAFYEPEFILKLALYTRDDLVCITREGRPMEILYRRRGGGIAESGLWKRRENRRGTIH